MQFRLLVLVAYSGLGLGFAPVSPKSTSRKVVSIHSEPSDTSSDYDDDEYIAVNSQSYFPTENDAAVTTLLGMVPISLGEEVPDGKRAILNEVILKLESMNPTEQPAKSSLVNGVWELRYAAGYTSEWAMASPTRQLALFLYSGGYSPGLFALGIAKKLPTSFVDIPSLEISISREQPRIQATVDLTSIFGRVSVEVIAKLEVESDIRLRETYESTTIMGSRVEFPEALQYSRVLYVTYVDEDILIIRDDSGVPELLVRKDKSFSKNWGTDPDESD